MKLPIKLPPASRRNRIKFRIKKRSHRWLITHVDFQCVPVAVTVLDPIGVLEYTYFRAGTLPPMRWSGLAVVRSTARRTDPSVIVTSPGSDSRDFHRSKLISAVEHAPEEFLTFSFHIESPHPSALNSQSLTLIIGFEDWR